MHIIYYNILFSYSYIIYINFFYSRKLTAAYSIYHTRIFSSYISSTDVVCCIFLIIIIFTHTHTHTHTLCLANLYARTYIYMFIVRTSCYNLLRLLYLSTYFIPLVYVFGTCFSYALLKLSLAHILPK